MDIETKTPNAKTCSICGKKLNFWTSPLKRYKGGKICQSCGWKLAKNEIKQVQKEFKKIHETRVTCLSCGNIWHYGKQEEMQNMGNAMQQAGKSMMCCTGCFPALLIPNQKVADFNKCPKCGSKAVKKEQVTHEVE